MPRPVHVSTMQLLRQFKRVQVNVTTVVIELQGEAFDIALSHLQNQPSNSSIRGQPDKADRLDKPGQPGKPDKDNESGRANRPTDVTENSFKIEGIEVRRV